MKPRNIKQLHLLMAVCGIVPFFAACDDSEDTISHTTEVPETITIPTSDELSVKVSSAMPTAVLSSFADNSTGNSLSKRLSVSTTAVADNTRMVLVKGSDMTTVSDEQIEQMTQVLVRGGYLAIETPTSNDLLSFIGRMLIVMGQLQEEEINQLFEFGPDVNPEENASATLSSRYKARMNTMQSLARQAGVSNADEVIAELIILSNTEYFMQEPGGKDIQMESTAYDDERNAGEKTMETVSIERTPYYCGLMADAAAEWLNDADKRQERTKAASRRLANKVGKESLNNLMDASETFSLSGGLYHRAWDNKVYYTRKNGIIHTFRSWGVHNMKTNKDYYYIQQSVAIHIKGDNPKYKIYFPMAEGNWYTATNYSPYNRWYGSFFSRLVTSLNLTGKGNITLEEAMPYTDNSTGYKTINIGSEHSLTETLGITWGANIGMDLGVSFGGEYSLGSTSGTYVEMSTTHVDSDISVVKNTAGNKVTWTYLGSVPMYKEWTDGKYIHYAHTIAPNALVNDINIDNQICWSVSNPTGQYTLEMTAYPYTAALLYEYTKDRKRNMLHKMDETLSGFQNNFTHTLLDPFRATQTWRMYVTIDKMKNDAPAGNAASQIEERLRTKFSDCYKDVLSLCDRTPTSVQVIAANVKNAKRIFKNNEDILQQFAQEQNVEAYTIHWRCDNPNIKLREGFAVKTY